MRRNQYVLLVFAVLLLASVLVIRQFLANQSAHFELREDFILLQERGEAKACERLYQALVESLPEQNERTLLDDLVRTKFLVPSNAANPDNLVWKYYVTVGKELQRRSEERVSRALERAEKR